MAVPKSFERAPLSTRRRWGENASTAFNFASDSLSHHGFSAPLTWKGKSLVPFSRDLTDKIRVIVSLSTFSLQDAVALFDSVAVLLSKTIFDLTMPGDPWHTNGSDVPAWHQGYKACLTIRLSHLKWAAANQPLNPHWLMALDDCAQNQSVRAWYEDWKALQLPLLENLKCDADLEQLLGDSLRYVRPPWVLSDGPRFAQLPSLLDRLKSRGSLRGAA